VRPSRSRTRTPSSGSAANSVIRIAWLRRTRSASLVGVPTAGAIPPLEATQRCRRVRRSQSQRLRSRSSRSWQNPKSRDPDFRANRSPQREPTPGTGQRAGPRAFARDSRRTAVSQSHAPAHPGGEFVNRAEIVRLQFRVVIQDFPFGHAGGEPTQDVPHGDAQPADTRLAGPFAWLDCDAGNHDSSISLPQE